MNTIDCKLTDLACRVSRASLPIARAWLRCLARVALVVSATISAHPLTALSATSSYQVQLRPGWNVVANQLSRGSNTLADVLPSVAPFSTFYRFESNPPGYTSSFFNPDLAAWEPNLPFNVGEGGFIRNPNPAYSVTFVGEVITPHLPLSLPYDQAVLVARQIPAPATYEQITGLPPSEGTKLYRYDPMLQGDPTILSNWVVYSFSQGQWTPATPNVSVGEPVFIRVPTPNSAPTNLPPLSLQLLTGGLIEVAWPTQTVNAVLQTASSLSGPWSVASQINPLQLPSRISQSQFFRLATAPSTAIWDLDGDGTHELEQSPDGLIYPTDTGFATVPARAWAVIQRNNGFIAYVDTQGSGHIDYGYLLADLNGDWVFSGPDEIQYIPAPDIPVCKECKPDFKLLVSVWTDQYKEPSGTVPRNTLGNLGAGTYVTLKVDGNCGGDCGPCGGGMHEMCDKSVSWDVQPNAPAPGSGYSTSSGSGTFYADRAAAFDVTVTVTCTGCGKKTTQQIKFHIGWGRP